MRAKRKRDSRPLSVIFEHVPTSDALELLARAYSVILQAAARAEQEASSSNHDTRGEVCDGG